MNDKLPITEIDLQAFVDGRLPPDRCAEIDDYLLAHPEAAQRVAAYREQNAELKALFDPVMDEPVPERLLAAAADSASTAGAKDHRSWTRIAAAAAWVALGGIIGWTLRDATPSAPNAEARMAVHSVPFARGAALAHVTYVPEKRHAVEVTADQEAHLAHWLSNRLGRTLKVPALTAQGYTLVGGRLLPGEGGPAAQFMYEDPRGGRLTLYLKTNAHGSDTAFRFAEVNGVRVFYWVDGQFGYALSGSLEQPRLLEVAKAVHGQVGR